MDRSHSLTQKMSNTHLCFLSHMFEVAENFKCFVQLTLVTFFLLDLKNTCKDVCTSNEYSYLEKKMFTEFQILDSVIFSRFL